MITMNFLPWRERARQRRKQHFFVALGGVAVLSGLLIYSIFGVYTSVQSQQQVRNDFLQEQIKFVNQEIEPLRQYKTEYESIVSRLKEIKSLRTHNFKTVKMFRELATVVPKGLFYEQMVYDQGKLNINGQALHNKNVSELIKNISDSKLLMAPQLSEISSHKDGGEHFSVELELVGSEDGTDG